MVPTDTPLDLGTVKLEEARPAKDQTVPPAAAGTMPNSKGKTVKAARAALDTSTSISVKDATAEGRWVPVVSNRHVCSRTPGAGAESKGRNVTLCPVRREAQ
ncbi:hypothetical protein [Streptomyces sp. NPDC001792]|uniref:hypothetical protein n=1 Tax=unclassified Streptomyces TaxID=2593676 RepID=UPI0033330A0B